MIASGAVSYARKRAWSGSSNPGARVRVYSECMLEVTGLHKCYGDLVAVEEVSFVARPGEMVGLLGPNGAGKTTTVAMIAGLLAPDRGEVRIEGGVVRGRWT